MASAERYADKPMLRLLECYALDVIGHLTPEDQVRLSSMEPKLSQTFGTHGTWQEIIGKAMQFPPEMTNAIDDLWTSNQAIAAKAGQTLTPQQFAEMFVDENFSDLAD